MPHIYFILIVWFFSQTFFILIDQMLHHMNANKTQMYILQKHRYFVMIWNQYG